MGDRDGRWGRREVGAARGGGGARWEVGAGAGAGDLRQLHLIQHGIIASPRDAVVTSSSEASPPPHAHHTKGG